MDQRIIWIAGDWEHADFAEATRWLRERARLLPCPFGKHGWRPEALANLEPLPYAILLFQSRPGQISHLAVEQFHADAPLARLVALVGPWCEGEQRSGRPWPGVARVAWRSWRERLPLALGIAGERAPLPRTATESDRLQRELAVWKHRAPSGAAVVRTNSGVTFEGLQAALNDCGFRATWASSGEPVESDVEFIDDWDQWPLFPGPPRILLLHFPRPDDLVRAQQLGAAAVLAQPLLLVDLSAALERVIALAPTTA